MSTKPIQVGINLLPPRFEIRRKQRRMAVLNLILGIVALAILTAIWLTVLVMVNDAKTQRDDVQKNVAVLQADVAALEPYRQKAEQLENSKQNLSFAMRDEVSWARVLNDLTMTVPHTASLQSFNATMLETTGEEQLLADKEGYSIGRIDTSGYSIERYKGVGNVLLHFAKSTSYINEFLSNTAESEIGATTTHTFSTTFGLSSKAYTERYANGLPESEQQND